MFGDAVRARVRYRDDDVSFVCEHLFMFEFLATLSVDYFKSDGEHILMHHVFCCNLVAFSLYIIVCKF